MGSHCVAVIDETIADILFFNDRELTQCELRWCRTASTSTSALSYRTRADLDINLSNRPYLTVDHAAHLNPVVQQHEETVGICFCEDEGPAVCDSSVRWVG